MSKAKQKTAIEKTSGNETNPRFTDRAFALANVDPSTRKPWAVRDGIYGDEKIWRHILPQKSGSIGPRRMFIRTYHDPVVSRRVLVDALRDSRRPATIEEVCALIENDRSLIRDHKDWVIPLGSAYRVEDDTEETLVVIGELRSSPGALVGHRMRCDGEWPARDCRLHFILVEEEMLPRDIHKAFGGEPLALTEGKDDVIDADFRVIEETVASL
ncbi:MAG: hypothetical protein AAB668_03445 [Patescibacteria group bacterium]